MLVVDYTPQKLPSGVVWTAVTRYSGGRLSIIKICQGILNKSLARREQTPWDRVATPWSDFLYLMTAGQSPTRYSWFFLKPSPGVFAGGGSQSTFLGFGSYHATPVATWAGVLDEKLLQRWFLEG